MGAFLALRWKVDGRVLKRQSADRYDIDLITIPTREDKQDSASKLRWVSSLTRKLKITTGIKADASNLIGAETVTLTRLGSMLRYMHIKRQNSLICNEKQVFLGLGESENKEKERKKDKIKSY